MSVNDVVPTMKPAELQQKHLRDPEDVTLPGAKFDHLTGFIGTVIEDFDLTKATDADIETIKELLAKRGVLHFRGQQNMGKKEQVEFCRRLGDPYIHKSVKADEFPELMKLHTDANSDHAFGAEAWHSDITFEQQPARWTCLRIVECPKYGGDTSFCWMPGVLDKLSAPVRALLSQAWATHESAHVFATSYGEAHRQAENGDKGANAKAVDAPEYPSAIHPVIIRHPITGVESLYVNRGFTTKIIGLQPYESKALLSMIYDVQSNATEYSCRIRWTPNSLTIWDNQVTAHTANFDYRGHTRTGYRVTTLDGRSPEAASPALRGGASKL